MTVDGVQVELVRTKAVGKSRWDHGTGAAYDVEVEDKGKIGSVHSARLSSPPPRGSRLRTGAEYTAWGSEIHPAMRPGSSYYERGIWSETRRQAVAWVVWVYKERLTGRR
jgi:hypothetical protein